MFKNYCSLCISDKSLCAYCKIISGPPTHFRKKWKESDMTLEKLIEIKKKGEEKIKIRGQGVRSC
ncbi:hypothetical protein BR63_08720 [Thermanaerosceptrum fracticalcis]|uniref:Uncharacterized protein n=1 Tax=Thermanaerosceptrum fracticalcis TaxID=1712410 RepID=A0A7G6E2T6_THEFR|nr:hypothetical protein [Thermanaerosceptrum fracticalcis]QNB46390.1 hypothetical protein BR63_08720 [Thermanaerosceptrum fracticalcis]